MTEQPDSKDKQPSGEEQASEQKPVQKQHSSRLARAIEAGNAFHAIRNEKQ